MLTVPSQQTAERTRLSVVVAGHVDHGKSTVIGRLLADTHSLPDGKLEQIRALCARTSKPFEHAFLLDALKDERAQGITIDSARVFFKTSLRDYIIIDAPGHIEFLKNMMTGAARAEAALLVIDAHDGIQENSRRHAYLLSLLGIRHVAVLVNKMDLAAMSRDRFAALEHECRDLLGRVGIRPAAIIPVIGRDGDNIATRSARLAWYSGPTVLDTLDAFPADVPDERQPFRLPVQDVYKFTRGDDDRRIIAGRVESGRARVGDELVFYPSGKRAAIRSFEAFNQPRPMSIGAGESVGLTLREQIYVSRGEMATLASEPRPSLSSRFRATLVWLGRVPLATDKDYVIKIGSARASVRVETIHRVIDTSDLTTNESAVAVHRHEIAECTLRCARALAFDTTDISAATSRFVIVDDFEISGGGLVREALPDRQDSARELVLRREYKWEPSFIAPERRAARLGQRATLLLITGPKETDRKGLAKQLESRLFDEGRVAYFLGIGNVLYGVDADLARDREHQREHIRRLGEVANLMLDAGMILIVSAQALTPEDLELLETSIDSSRIQTVWIGDRAEGDLPCDLVLSDRAPDGNPDERNVERVRELLAAKGVLVAPKQTSGARPTHS